MVTMQEALGYNSAFGGPLGMACVGESMKGDEEGDDIPDGEGEESEDQDEYGDDSGDEGSDSAQKSKHRKTASILSTMRPPTRVTRLPPPVASPSSLGSASPAKDDNKGGDFLLDDSDAASTAAGSDCGSIQDFDDLMSLEVDIHGTGIRANCLTRRCLCLFFR